MLMSRSVPLFLSIDAIGFEHTKDVSVAVVHEPAQKSSFEYGRPIEPERPESYSLAAVWLTVGPMRVDISELLNDKEVERLLDIVVKKIKKDQEDMLVEHKLKQFNRED